jgi:hypothetical protein
MHARRGQMICFDSVSPAFSVYLVHIRDMPSASRPPLLPLPLPLCPVFVVAAAKLGIVVRSGGRWRDWWCRRRGYGWCGAIRAARWWWWGGRRFAVIVVVGGGRGIIDKIARIEQGVLVLLNQLAHLRVARVDELGGGEPRLVLDARVGAGLEHHFDEGLGKGLLGGGFGVGPADGCVERGVAFTAGDWVAFEAGLVEEGVDDFVWRVSGPREARKEEASVGKKRRRASEARIKSKRSEDKNVQFP